MREYCERDENGTGPLLDEDEGEEVRRRRPELFCGVNSHSSVST